MDTFFRDELRKIVNGDFSRFPFLHNLERTSLGQFTSILKSLILNLTVRFFDISASLDKRRFNGHLDYDQALIRPEAPLHERPICCVDKLFDAFYMKGAIVHQHLPGPLAHLGIQHEWAPFMAHLMANLGPVAAVFEGKRELLSEREKAMMEFLQMRRVPSIVDAFGVIPRAYFPQLWRFVVRMLTIMPTTVACEQSFSFFKRTLHTNMSEQTAKILLFTRMNLYNRNYNL